MLRLRLGLAYEADRLCRSAVAAFRGARYPASVEVAELVIQKNEQSLLHLRLTQAETYIGRMPSNDVVLPDEAVPDVAAVLIDRGAHRFVLRDASDGRITISGAPLQSDEIELTDGATLQLGPYVLRLKVRPAAHFDRGGQTSVLGGEANSAWRAHLRFGARMFSLKPGQPFNVGSHDDNDLVLSDSFVSGFHCRISSRRGRWTIADLGSTNGTKVNGLKITEAELPAPATIEVGKATLTFEAIPRESEAGSPTVFQGMIATSRVMREVFRLIERFADATEPVLVFGESGSGKELVARALHDLSNRDDKPYLALNCGALNSQLIESELFGHIKGAFTGATRDKIGAFEATSGGTLFLDEVGELPLDLQPKLLRVLETKTVRAVGSTKEVPVDTRVIAATHRNLEKMVIEGAFREDLFHRLFVLSLSIPPLSQRADDISVLAKHFLQAQAPRPMKLAADAKKSLEMYSWPGNVRELRNVIVRAILMTDGNTIRASNLQFTKDAFSRPRDARRTLRHRDQNERERIVSTLKAVNGNKTEAARVLRMSKSTFYDRLRRYGIASRDSDP